MKKMILQTIVLIMVILSALYLMLSITGCGSKKEMSPVSWQWAVKPEGGYRGNYCMAVDIDNNGYIYVTGHFKGTVAFGDIELQSGSEGDAFIAKLSPDREWLWVRQVLGQRKSRGYNIKVDSNGNCYVSGGFEGKTKFSEAILNSGEQEGRFFAKLSNEGEWLWVKDLLGEDEKESTVRLTFALDSDDNLYLLGSFSGTASFGSQKLKGGNEMSIFVAKTDPEGNIVRTTKATNSDLEGSRMSIATNNIGEIFVSSSFTQTITLGDIVLENRGTDNIFVASINEQGEWTRAIAIENSDEDLSMDLVADSKGNCYIYGEFKEDIRIGQYDLTAGKHRKVFIAKLNSHGEWDWAVTADGNRDAQARSLVLDRQEENLYLTGLKFSSGATVFNIFPYYSKFGNYLLKHQASHSAGFIARISAAGQWQWAVTTPNIKQLTELNIMPARETTWLEKLVIRELCEIIPFNLAFDKEDNCYFVGIHSFAVEDGSWIDDIFISSFSLRE